ncbi:MAG: DUF1573 domain-containing protein [Patescibacteria group bacterium]
MKLIYQIFILIGLLLVVALVAGFFTKKAGWQEFPIVVEPALVDFGEVSMAKGTVETEFIVRNNSKTDISINSLLTSCGCTAAKLVLEDGSESPVFGMHDNPTDWSGKIGAGKTAKMKVSFDPNAHGSEAVGPFTRTVSIFFGEPVNQKMEVKLKGTVIK